MFARRRPCWDHARSLERKYRQKFLEFAWGEMHLDRLGIWPQNPSPSPPWGEGAPVQGVKGKRVGLPGNWTKYRGLGMSPPPRERWLRQPQSDSSGEGATPTPEEKPFEVPSVEIPPTPSSGSSIP